MLFSAGTFLYVATVHVLPEISSSRTGRRFSDFQQHTEAEAQPSDFRQHSGVEHHHQQYLGLLESLTLILGIGLPVVLALGLSDDWAVNSRAIKFKAKDTKPTSLKRKLGAPVWCIVLSNYLAWHNDVCGGQNVPWKQVHHGMIWSQWNFPSRLAIVVYHNSFPVGVKNLIPNMLSVLNFHSKTDKRA